MEAEHAMGNHDGVRSLLQDLLRLLDADGDAITEETSDLIARLGFFRISDLQSNGATAETGDKHAPLRMTLSQIPASNAVA